jgi:hypothetical protein
MINLTSLCLLNTIILCSIDSSPMRIAVFRIEMLFLMEKYNINVGIIFLIISFPQLIII